MKKPTRPTTPEEEGIELRPDAWRRFERTVDKVLSGDPVHRGAKPTGEGQPRKASRDPSAKRSR